MFDTVALSQTRFWRPDHRLLSDSRAKWVGASIFVNAQKGSHEPRITFTRVSDHQYICRPEVSIGAWLFGSNLHLPSFEDIPDFLALLENYVGEKTGFVLESLHARVARLDVTHDFKIEPSLVLKIIDDYRSFRWSKRNTVSINGTTVSFDSKAKGQPRSTCIYSKYHQLLAAGEKKHSLSMAEGILRLEDKYRVNRTVKELSKSLGLSDHTARSMLTEKVYSSVLSRTVNQLGLESVMEQDQGRIRKVYSELGNVRAGHLLEHLALERSIGKDYFRNSLFATSGRAARSRAKEALHFGLLRLE